MSVRTPESKVKQMVKQRLEQAGFVAAGRGVLAERWYTLLVLGPYSTNGISDFIGMDRGVGWAIETKVKGKHPTPLQQDFLMLVEAAGGVAEVVRDGADVDRFLARLEESWTRRTSSRPNT